MVGVIVRGNEQVDGVDASGAEPISNLARSGAGIDQDRAPGGSANDGGVALADVEEGEGELRGGLLRGGAKQES